jgi:hypothetical protein
MAQRQRARERHWPTLRLADTADTARPVRTVRNDLLTNWRLDCGRQPPPFGVAMLTPATLFSTMFEASAINLIALGFVTLSLVGLGLVWLNIASAMR